MRHFTMLLGTVIIIICFIFIQLVQAAPVELLQDGGFEDGTPSADWTEFSTNFGTPIVDDSVGQEAHSGSYFAWFGGGPFYELGILEQTVSIPNGEAVLSFFFKYFKSGFPPPSDTFEIRMDGYLLWVGSDIERLTYTKISLDIAPFADGGTHELAIKGEVLGTPHNNFSNFFIDDVSILANPEAPVPVPSTMLLLGTGLVGLAGFRRRSKRP